MNPEDGGRAPTSTCGGGLLIPVHWATFNLALHAWSEPVERLLARGRRPRHHARDAPSR